MEILYTIGKIMKIIGHRGAAGLALENTLESIHTAIRSGADAIEIDVRLTKDKHLVLSHDPNTGRVSEHDVSVHTTPLAEIQKIALHNGKPIPTLKQAILAVADTPLIIEAKSDGWALPLAALVHNYRHKDISVISFNLDELAAFTLLCPDVPVYALERWSPYDVIQAAKRLNLTGIDISFWILNPMTYWWARRARLKIIVFTVDNVWMARFLKLLYPHIGITTNHPDKLGYLSDIGKSHPKHRRKSKRTS